MFIPIEDTPVTPFDREFEAIEDSDFEPFVINGTEVTAGEFTSVVAARRPGCTAAFTGPDTLFSAAHCFDRFGTMVIRNSEVGRVIANCERHPDYVAGNKHADIAACKLQTHTVQLPKFDTIAPDSRAVTPGDRLVYLGAGCTTVIGTGSDRKVRIGQSTVVSAPTRNQSSRFIIDNGTPGTSLLCPGDSGGPTFVITGADTNNRNIVAANSRISFDDNNGVPGFQKNSSDRLTGPSLFAAAYTENARQFLTTWTMRNSATMCGINLFDPSRCNGM